MESKSRMWSENSKNSKYEMKNLASECVKEKEKFRNISLTSKVYCPAKRFHNECIYNIKLSEHGRFVVVNDEQVNSI